MHIHSICLPCGGCGVDDMVGTQIRASKGLAPTGVGGIFLLGNLLERHTDCEAWWLTQRGFDSLEGPRWQW